MEPETIDVRIDEKIDSDKLVSYLVDRQITQTESILPNVDVNTKPKIRQFGGGAANLTYLLDYGTQEYVLRRPPLGEVAKSSHDMIREHTVLSVIHKKFEYAPRSYLLCEDPSVIGNQFFIMERKKGYVIRKTYPDEFRDIPESARKISESLVDTLVKLHQVDYTELGLQNLGKPEGFILRQINGWYDRWNKAKHQDFEKMGLLYNWLIKNQPETSIFSIIHNDYKLDNVMIDFDDPSKLVGVFDWDMSTLGDPMSDLGAMLAYWSQPDDPEYFKQMAMMPTEDLGFYTREQLIKRYAQKSGNSVSEINFYHVLGVFRLIVIVAQIYIRFLRKQTLDKRFAAFGPMIPILLQFAYEIAYEN